MAPTIKPNMVTVTAKMVSAKVEWPERETWSVIRFQVPRGVAITLNAFVHDGYRYPLVRTTTMHDGETTYCVDQAVPVTRPQDGDMEIEVVRRYRGHLADSAGLTP